MTLIKVPTVRTQFTLEEFTRALVKGWFSLYNVYPSKSSIAVIYGQNSLETGCSKFCWNYNIGNAKVKDEVGKEIEYCVLNNVWEIINGVKVILPPDSPGSWFRSFKTLDDGILFHLDFLKNKRYKSSFKYIEAGDPVGFCHDLKRLYYYSAPEEQYRAGVVAYFNIFMKNPIFDKILNELKIENDKKNEIIVEPEIEIPKIEITKLNPIKLTFWQSIVEIFLKLFKL
jgi:hypothetical protein